MMKKLHGGRLAALAVGLTLFSLISTSHADEKKVAGTWKRSSVTNTGDRVEWTLVLKQEGKKLTGTYRFSGGASVEIKDGKLEDDTISFTIEQVIKGQTIKADYSGKLEGNMIKGTIESERPDGTKRVNDWEMKREDD